jgi:predicted AAA+ superfamily ATPase
VLINRQIENKILYALNNFRIIYIDGARQTGKSTFVKQVANKKGFRYITFDDLSNLSLAQNNPKLFFETNPPPLIIDEAQKAPSIIEYIKSIVDEQSDTKGQFILTGSVDLLKSARINESLAGRMVGYELYPFSYAELGNTNFNIVEVLFKQNFYKYFENIEELSHDEILNRIVTGGFPEIQTIDVSLHRKWFSNYFKARISKDINDLTENNLRKINKIPDLLKLLSSQSSNLLNISNLSNKLKISPYTIENYIYLLEAMFLIERLKPYEKNIGKQVKKNE